MNSRLAGHRQILIVSVASSLVVTLIFASARAAPTLTLNTTPGINYFIADDHLISGMTVTNVTPQPAAFDAFHHSDANHDGEWNGPDGRRKAIGTYDNGLFGLYSLSQSLGAFTAAVQTVQTKGLLVIDDLMITTDDVSPPATIETSLNFHASGSTSHYNYVAQPDLIASVLDMSITLNGTVFNGTYGWTEFGGVTIDVSGLGTQIAGGGFSEDFSATITTGLATVPVNTPFTLRMEFNLAASAGGGSFNSYGGMVFDARDSLGFLAGESIFNNLPGGYEVNSGTGIIVNNMTVAPAPIPGDGNGDGWVDGLDYLLWAGNFGTHPGIDGDISDGDYNDDGWVDGLDYLLWAGNFGSHAATSVPEPGSGLMVALGWGIVVVGRRRR